MGAQQLRHMPLEVVDLLALFQVGCRSFHTYLNLLEVNMAIRITTSGITINPNELLPILMVFRISMDNLLKRNLNQLCILEARLNKATPVLDLINHSSMALILLNIVMLDRLLSPYRAWYQDSL